MNPALRKKLLAVASGGAIAIAAVMVRDFEGRRYTVYLDPAGIPTVCDGITGPDVIRNKTYTDKECDMLREKHLKIAEAEARRVLTFWDTYDIWTQAALIDFTFNLGAEKLAGSTVARRFNAGDRVGGCDQLLRWVKATVKGKLVTLNGLVTRRSVEAEICLGGAPL